MENEERDHARRIASLDDALGRAILIASARAEHSLIRDAVIDLLGAADDLQGRLDVPDGTGPDPRTLSAYGKICHVLHDILTRANWEETQVFEDDRLVCTYSPPKGPTCGDLVKWSVKGPDGEIVIRRPADRPLIQEGEFGLDDSELEELRRAQNLLRSGRELYPSAIMGVPERKWTKEEVFPIGWPEEDCEKARSLFLLGLDWKEASCRQGPGPKAARRAYVRFRRHARYILTFLHRYFDLPRAGADSPFAREAERLTAALSGIEDATRFWSPAGPFRKEPTRETWAALDVLAGAIDELDAAIAAYRSSKVGPSTVFNPNETADEVGVEKARPKNPVVSQAH